MKIHRILLFVIFIGFVPATLFAKPEVINQVVAVVDNAVITSDEVSRQLALIKYRVKKQGKEKMLPPDKVLRTQILQQLINRSLQTQIAKQSGIKATSAQVTQAIARIAKQNKLSTRSLYQHMKKNGFSIKQFRDEVKGEIIMQTLQGRDVASRINISQAEVNDVLKRMRQQSVEYDVGDILIAIPAVPTPAQVAKAQAKAKAIIAKIHHGANFSHLAMTDSQASNALKGGDLGWRKLAELPAVFADRVVSMNPGEVTGPVKAANGFHIIKLYGLKNVKLPKSAAAQRKEVERLLFQQQFQQALITWMQQLRSEAYVKIY